MNNVIEIKVVFKRNHKIKHIIRVIWTQSTISHSERTEGVRKVENEGVFRHVHGKIRLAP